MTSTIKDLIPIDLNSHSPLYMQVRNALRNAVASRAIASNEVLPPEREMAEQLGISRITVRKALEGLVDEGLIERRRGVGTFVIERAEKSLSALSSFTEDMLTRGRRPRTEWISRRSAEIGVGEAFACGLPPGMAVYRFDRIRFADDLPMAVEYSIVPASCLPSAAAVEGSLYEALRRYGRHPARALQRIRGVQLERAEADLLGIEVGQVGLLIERRSFDAAGQPIEVTRSYYRGDAYEFVSELSVSSLFGDEGDAHG